MIKDFIKDMIKGSEEIYSLIVISSAFHNLYRIYGFIEKNYP